MISELIAGNFVDFGDLPLVNWWLSEKSRGC